MNHKPRTFDDTTSDRDVVVPLHVGIVGPSNSGKTWSALRLGTGMQKIYGGDIWGIDTENNRMLHYRKWFNFRHVNFKPPFGSLDYVDAIRHCITKGARVIIIDSATHEHIGEGGYLETAENTVTRIAGNDFKKRERCKMLGWAAAGPLRQYMIESLKQFDGAFIWCWRAKEKVKPRDKGAPANSSEDDEKIVNLGLMPIGGLDWVYEMTVNCLLPPGSKGVPQWRSDRIGERMMMKIPEQFKGLFKEGEPLTEDIGRRLAEWASGKVEAPKPEQPAERFADTPVGPDALLTAGRAAAARGRTALAAWFNALTKNEQARASRYDTELCHEANEVDAEREADRRRDEAEQAENGDEEAA